MAQDLDETRGNYEVIAQRLTGSLLVEGRSSNTKVYQYLSPFQAFGGLANKERGFVEW